jgi:hypothetical protein
VAETPALYCLCQERLIDRPLRRTPGLPRRLLAVAAILILVASALPIRIAAVTTWSRNLYTSSAFMYQDPYYTACTAAAVMIMLNTAALRHTGGDGFVWTPTRLKNDTAHPTNYRDMVSILGFERAYDTLRRTAAGSDAHGWRNALNSYGWGHDAMVDPTKMVYDDRAYRSFDAAAHAAVRAIAQFAKPVGILGWAGGHAQVMTGYIVTGSDPAVSNDFVVNYIYLSDPLRSDAIVNRRISATSWHYGNLHYRFQRYRETDSPHDDGYTPGTIRSSVSPLVGPSEWYHRWVLVLPIRNGLATPAPSPTPAPTPPPTPTPAASATPSQSTSPKPSVTPSTSSAPTPTPVPTSPPTTSPTASPYPSAPASP